MPGRLAVTLLCCTVPFACSDEAPLVASGAEDGDGAKEGPPWQPAEVPPSAQALIDRLKTRFRVDRSMNGALEVLSDDLGPEDPSILAPAQAERVEREEGSFRPRFAREAAQGVIHPATLKLPLKAEGMFEVVDGDSRLSMGVKLVGASTDVEGEDAGGYLVYRGGFESSADVVHRPTVTGTEDFVVFEQPPAREEITYELSLGADVAGVRVVEGVVELLDATGTPRLRMSSARVFDANGTAREMRVRVDGCAFDSDPRAPWGRPVTEPKSRMCVVHLGWSGGSYPLMVDPVWTATGQLITGRWSYIAELLNHGLPTDKVLVAGGSGASGALASAELWDPSTNTWAATGSLVGPARLAYRSVRLPNGKVLVTGGYNGTTSFTNSEWYNEGTGNWSATTGALNQARYAHTMTLLNNGFVLSIGGHVNSVSVSSVEQFDPATQMWTVVSSLNTSRGSHTTTMLPNDKLLVAGGTNSSTCGTPTLASTEIFDPITMTSQNGAALNQGRGLHTASLLGNGQVLVAGGLNGAGGCAATNTSELYNPSTNQWTLTNTPMGTNRAHFRAVSLNGSMLVAGGYDAFTARDTAELYDPALNQWSSAGTMNASRWGLSLTLLNDGRVLAAGGQGTNPRSADVFALGPGANGISCTSNSNCQSGYCVDGVCCQVAVCAALDQCHNAGTCQPGTGLCSNPNKVDGSSCNDSNACTQSDTCQAGACAGANPVVCAALDQCHDAGTCDSATGMCSNPMKMDGSSCNDSNACTQSDTCQAGACTGANPVTCAALDQCHDAGACDSATGICSNPNKADGSSCNDSNACTQTDTCQAGACTGANPVTCAALDQCHDAGTCDSATGMCDNPAKMDGSSCNDSNACTQSDTCQAGACTGTNPVVCAALDQCHDVGTCDSATGMCDNPPKNDNTVCDDSNACTQSDTCQAGACTGVNPVVCAALDQCHDVGTCDSATGMCDNPDKPDNTPCDDGNACTQSDTCQAGACSGEKPVVCAALDQCHDVGTCDSATGMCDNPDKPDNTPCDKGTCQAGTCTPTGTGGAGGMGGMGESSSSSSGNPSDDPTVEGGCACRTAGGGGGSSDAGALMGLALAALTMARRRK